MREAVLIPARKGSRRVPGKNVRVLGRHPLLVWSVLTGLEITPETYVSTDSEEYGDITYRAGAKVVYREGVSDDQADLDVVRHFVDRVVCDVVVYLRPTTPFRQTGVVREAIRVFEGTGLRSVQEMSESAYKCFEIDSGRLVPVSKFMGGDMTDWPNGRCPKTYHPNGYVDLVRSEYVRRGQLWGPDKQAFITERVIEIDTEDDFEYAQYWVNRNPSVKYTIGYERL